ncbi:hypothetical protein FN846DRAFT_891382 [Sphaerosporella brunnea]|uniref:Uncharacterized protein n=1 Tax=Sphaerosporella brunnea TaxID=1250544 RepID=A0A5J5ESM6_9PEZI|nr:hypothetical protein FN846DRAFT_891382 [Sphaerosporella brunnea]
MSGSWASYAFRDPYRFLRDLSQILFAVWFFRALMDVSRKRDNIYQSNAASGKRRKLNNGLSSGLDGGYWLRAPARRSTASQYSHPAPKPATGPQDNQLAICQKFDVGLSVVFGHTSFPSPPRVKPYEIEEPESPPNRHSPHRILGSEALVTPKPENDTYPWNFTPSWETIRIGARILKQALVFPIAVARFLIDVAPETRQQARLLEAARREREQLLLDQWLAKRSQDHESSSESDLSDPPSSPSPPPDLTTMSTTGTSGSGGGAGPSRRPSLHPQDPNAGLLSQFQQMIDASMAKLKLELSRKPNDPATRDDALRAELENMQAKKKRNRPGQWQGPTTSLSPTTIYVAPASTAAGGSGPAKPRFNPGDLPGIAFGDDLEEWISQIDHIVTSFGELVVCPHILHRCFAVGDPMRDWYLTKPSEVHLFVTTGDGCWGHFKTLLRARFKPDLGVMQFEADSYRKLPGDSWAAFGIRKYRLLKRAYEGSDEANIILKIKAVMGTEVVRFCKEKSDIDTFIGELMDYDRTSPPTARSAGRIFTSEHYAPTDYQHQPRSTTRPFGQQQGNPSVGLTTPRYQKDKGKAVDRGNQDRGNQDRSNQDRKATVQNRPHPETGKMVRSYLNYQGKPVFIKRPCNVCEKNGVPNQMHFSFECSRGFPTLPRTYAMDGTEEVEEFTDGLHRTESGNLTSYNFQSEGGPQEVMYHHDSEEGEQGNGNGENPCQTPGKFGTGSKKTRMKESKHTPPVAGSRWGKPPSGLAQGEPMGGHTSHTSDDRADERQTAKVNPQHPILPEGFHRIEDEFCPGNTRWSKEKHDDKDSGGRNECKAQGGMRGSVDPGGTGKCDDPSSPVAGSSWDAGCESG